MPPQVNNASRKQCSVCKSDITTSKNAMVCKLETCEKAFHSLCINAHKLTESERVNWTCPDCKAAAKKGGDNTATPIRNQPVDNVTTRKKTTQQSQQSKKATDTAMPLSPLVPETNPIQCDNVSGDNEISLAREMQQFRNEFVSMRNEITILSANFEKLSQAIQGLDGRIGTLEQRVQVLEERPDPAASASNDMKELKDTVDRLKLELNDRDQELLSTEVEITGLVETTNESPVHLAVLVAQKLSVEVEPRDVVSAERIGMRRAAVADAGGDNGRPRALVVRLARRALKDELLRAARRARGAEYERLRLARTDT